ncbi:MAG: MSHA biogenesis protein MshN [Shewanella sp.]
MSVINSMLKNLDKRQQSHDLEQINVTPVQFQAKPVSRLPWILLAIISVMLLSGAGYSWQALSNTQPKLAIKVQASEPDTRVETTEDLAVDITSVSMANATSSKVLSDDIETEATLLVTSSVSSTSWLKAENQKVVDSDPAVTSSTSSNNIEPVIASDLAVESTPVAIKPVEFTAVESTPVATKPVEFTAVESTPVAAKSVEFFTAAESTPVAAKSVEFTAVESTPVATKSVAAKPSSMTITEVQMSNEQLAQRSYRLAIEAENQGLLNDAIVYHSDTLTLSPNMHEARRRLAALYYGIGRLDSASDILIKATVLFPEEYDYVFLLARVRQASGNIRLAMSSLERIPDESQLAKQKWTLQSSLAQKSNNYILAEESYRKLLRLDDKQAKWWMGLGYALDSLLEYDPAKQAYIQALSADGLSEQAREYIENRLVQLGDSE